MTDGDVHDPGLEVGGERCPGVVLPGDLPRAVEPRVVAELPRSRDEVEDPALAAGTYVESADRRRNVLELSRVVALDGRAADDDDVVDDDRRRADADVTFGGIDTVDGRADACGLRPRDVPALCVTALPDARRGPLAPLFEIGPGSPSQGTSA
jgi:hypothetical protein